jgi:hypothetical protein
MSEIVYLKCVKVGSKLRVRIISDGYNPNANCQFPRAIRRERRKYSVPVSAISFAKGPAGKFFYRVRKGDITVVGEIESVNKVYGDEKSTCVVCWDEENDVVVVPCGHFCLCQKCAGVLQNSTRKCPLCRGEISMVVDRSQIQT